MLSHAIGVQYLLERRGPAPFDSHAEAIMFLQARMIMVRYLCVPSFNFLTVR